MNANDLKGELRRWANELGEAENAYQRALQYHGAHATPLSRRIVACARRRLDLATTMTVSMQSRLAKLTG